LRINGRAEGIREPRIIRKNYSVLDLAFLGMREIPAEIQELLGRLPNKILLSHTSAWLPVKSKNYEPNLCVFNHKSYSLSGEKLKVAYVHPEQVGNFVFFGEVGASELGTSELGRSELVGAEVIYPGEL
jgi:hypothetical protein